MVNLFWPICARCEGNLAEPQSSFISLHCLFVEALNFGFGQCSLKTQIRLHNYVQSDNCLNVLGGHVIDYIFSCCCILDQVNPQSTDHSCSRWHFEFFFSRENKI